MAIDGDRQLLYVADSKKHQVFCYSTVDGAAVRTIGRRGSEPGEFNFPTNVFVDKEGRLYVTDTLNFRIQSFDPDGKPLRAFGTLGDTPGSLNRPKGIGVDDEGHIYVADSSFNNFQIFDQAGQLLLFVGFGRIGRRRVLPAGGPVHRRPQPRLRGRPGQRPRAGVPVPARAGRSRRTTRADIGATGITQRQGG